LTRFWEEARALLAWKNLLYFTRNKTGRVRATAFCGYRSIEDLLNGRLTGTLKECALG
jgi:hypothetical protein